MKSSLSIGIVGAGKVGQTLALLAARSGYRITAVYNRTRYKAAVLAEQLASAWVDEPGKVARTADLTLIAISDDAIETVVSSMIDEDWTGKGVIHTSGAGELSLLDPLARCGAMIGCLHPIFPFANVESSVESFVGVSFGLEAPDSMLRGWLLTLVEDLQGHAILLQPGQKALYHAALAIASNYTVTLYAIAEKLLLKLDAQPDSVQQALVSLMRASLVNLEKQGVPLALTGPLVRGDVKTIQAHLAALDALQQDEVAQVYRLLARLSYPMLAARGINIQLIENSLKQDGNDASHHP